MITHNDTFKIRENLYAQYIAPRGDLQGRKGWRVMDRLGNGIFVSTADVSSLMDVLTLVGNEVVELVAGCDVGTVTGVQPAL